MAYTTQDELQSQRLDEFEFEQEPQPDASSGSGKRWLILAGAIAVVGVIVLLAFVMASGGESETARMLTHTVRASDLVVTVTEDGSLESASNIDIKCQVAGGTSILWIVQDGKEVKAGEKIVELDASALEDQINSQRIAYEKARSAMIQAEKDYAVAKIAVQEYLEGIYLKELQDAEALITIALENQRSAENALEHSQRMFRKGYISSLELEGQQFAVERAKLELDSARTAKKVLEQFSKVKMLQELESVRDTAEARMQSEKAAFELEEARLRRLESQLKNCVILAPQDGMVVFANESGGRFGQSNVTVEEGAAVREQQTILRLPDLAQMQVKVAVHESKVERLAPGMRARIRIQDRELQGTVVSIANQPEPTSFFSANVKEYATIVRIDGQPDNLKPGMTAEVEILVAHLKDQVTVPVAAVVERRDGFFSWVKDGEKLERRELMLGMSNDQFVAVKDGVAVGDQVVLNPRAIIAEARADEADDDEGSEESVTERFGAAREAPAGGPGMAPGAPGSGPSAGPGARGAPGAGPGPGAGAGGPGGGGPGVGGPGGGNGSGGRPNLMANDTDGDGKLSRSEAPERMQPYFDRVDSNADGFIDEQEASAMRSRGGGGGSGGPGGGAGGRSGTGGGPGGGGFGSP